MNRLLLAQSKRLSRRGLYRFLDKVLPTLKAEQRVLNVGAGGEVAHRLDFHARTARCRVVSLDIDDRRGPDVAGDICALPFQYGCFDVVIMIEVLEHVRHPNEAIGSVLRALRPGGRLILSTPFVFPIHDRPFDYFRFTRYGLEALLEEFEEVFVEARDSWAEACALLPARIVAEGGRSCRVASPFMVLWAYLQWPFARLLGKLVRTDFITTGYVATALRPKSVKDLMKTGGGAKS